MDFVLLDLVENILLQVLVPDCLLHACNANTAILCIVLLIEHLVDVVSWVVVLDCVEVEDAVPVHSMGWVLKLILLANATRFNSFRIYDWVLNLLHSLQPRLGIAKQEEEFVRHYPIGAGDISVNCAYSLLLDPIFVLVLLFIDLFFNGLDGLFEGLALWLLTLQVGLHLSQPFLDQGS